MKEESATKEALMEKIDLLESQIVELQTANSYLNVKIRQYEQDTFFDGPDEYTKSQISYDRFF